METGTKNRWGAAILILAPITVLVAFLTHPHIGTRVGEPGLYDAIATEVAADPGMWIFSHLLLAVGSGLLAIAFIALRGYLREAGEDRWSAIGLPFIVLGSVLFALLPAMEMAPVAAHEAGVDVAAVQQALDETVFPMVLFAGSAIFAIGAIAFAGAVGKAGVMGQWPARGIAAALVIVAITRFVPVFAVLFYVQSAALIAALWPLAVLMWKDAEADARGARQPVASA